MNKNQMTTYKTNEATQQMLNDLKKDFGVGKGVITRVAIKVLYEHKHELAKGDFVEE